MKKILIAITLIFVSFLLIIILDPFNQVEKGQRRFFERALKPSHNYVENKLLEHKRLPSDEEFKKWAYKNYPNKFIDYYSSKPDFMKEWCNTDNCYVIGAWNGDSVTYYKSWDDSFFYGRVH